MSVQSLLLIYQRVAITNDYPLSHHMHYISAFLPGMVRASYYLPSELESQGGAEGLSAVLIIN